MTQPTNTPHASSLPPAPNLPAEVLGNIIEDLLPDDKSQEHRDPVDDFKALSIVSRAWARETQRVLFRSVTLHPATYRLNGNVVKGPDTLSQFASLIATSPHLGQYVKELKIIIPYKRREEYTKLTESAALAHALDQIPLLSKLDLQNELRKPGKRGDYDDCSVHGRRNKEIVAALVSRTRKPSVFLQAILRLLPQITELGLHNISLPATFLSTCINMQCLNLYSANLSLHRRGPEIPDSLCPALKKLQLDAHALICLKKLLGHPRGEKVRGRLSEIKELAIDIQAPEHLSKNSAQSLLLGQLTGLRWLMMVGPPYFNPAEDQDFAHITSPLAHLNPASFQTLVSLTFSACFDLNDDNSLIKDPYQGLLRNGVILMLTQLEGLQILVSMTRSTWEGYDGAAFLGDQCQWSQLDRVLASRGIAQPAVTQLASLEMLVMIHCHVVDDAVWEILGKVMKQVFECQFPSITELEQKGKTKFNFKSGACEDGR